MHFGCRLASNFLASANLPWKNLVAEMGFDFCCFVLKDSLTLKDLLLVVEKTAVKKSEAENLASEKDFVMIGA